MSLVLPENQLREGSDRLAIPQWPKDQMLAGWGISTISNAIPHSQRSPSPAASATLSLHSLPFQPSTAPSTPTPTRAAGTHQSRPDQETSTKTEREEIGERLHLEHAVGRSRTTTHLRRDHGDEQLALEAKTGRVAAASALPRRELGEAPPVRPRCGLGFDRSPLNAAASYPGSEGRSVRRPS